MTFEEWKKQFNPIDLTPAHDYALYSCWQAAQAAERKRLGLDDIDTLNHCAQLLRAGEWSKEAGYLEATAKAIEDKDGSDDV